VGGIPADPVLQVPAGFRVNVYAEGLSGPRRHDFRTPYPA
jgi:hypothetical protein